MLSPLFLAGFGLVALIGGGHLLVSGAVKLAMAMRLPQGLVGAVVLGFGTSFPELLTSIKAALVGSPGIAMGNVVGSNIANILLVLGLSLILRPINWDPSLYRRDVLWVLLAMAALLAALAAGVVPRMAGIAGLAGLAIYLLPVLRGTSDAATATGRDPIGFALLALAGGLATTILGASWLVNGGLSLARAWGISDAAIGLTLVAVGTSLPELATSAVAAWRGRGALALGNVLGSNVFNVLGILGVTAMISPLPALSGFTAADGLALAGSTACLAGVLLWRHSAGRGIGVAALACYAAYLWAVFAG